MCNVGSFGPQMQAAGAGMNAVGSYYEARSTQQYLRGQATTADMNARLLERSAQSALQAGERDFQRVKLNAMQIKEKQRTGYAAGNIDLGSESVVNVMTSSDVLAESDATEALLSASRQAWGYRTEATNQSNAARTARAQAKGISPFMNAATSLLTSAGQFSDKQGSRDTRDRNTPKASRRTNELPWTSTGQVRPAWLGGGRY